MTKFVGFSGPPRSGKDSIAVMFAAVVKETLGFQPQILSLSTPMREVVYALLGVPYSVTHYELHKDDPQEAFGGASIRQEMISLSEDHVKPRHGGGFWARSLMGRIWDPAPQMLIVTDCGFDSEVQEFGTHFGAEHCLFPQIVRPGTDFSIDSRGYVGLPDRITSIVNDEDIETAARRLFGRMLNQFGWVFG